MLQIDIKSLTKTYTSRGQTVCAFANVDLEIAPGEFVCILGPSGCGKTTLLRTIARLETPSSGHINVISDGNTQAAVNIAMVFQEQALFPWMTVSENITFLLQNNPQLQGRDHDQILQSYLEKVGLIKFAHLYPHQISGGMKQRVSLARSFANEPEILLMDEPFVFLDYQTRSKLQNLLLHIWAETQKTVVFVTHDVEEALLLADRVVVMGAHPGTIIEQISLNFSRPRIFSGLRENSEFLSKLKVIDRLLGVDQSKY